jgi:hypothetical protein
MHRNTSTWTALAFAFILLTATARGEGQDHLTFNSAASNLTFIDFESAVDMQRHPQNNPGAPDQSLAGSLALLLAGIIGMVLVRYRS